MLAKESSMLDRDVDLIAAALAGIDFDEMCGAQNL